MNVKEFITYIYILFVRLRWHVQLFICVCCLYIYKCNTLLTIVCDSLKIFIRVFTFYFDIFLFFCVFWSVFFLAYENRSLLFGFNNTFVYRMVFLYFQPHFCLYTLFIGEIWSCVSGGDAINHQYFVGVNISYEMFIIRMSTAFKCQTNKMIRVHNLYLVLINCCTALSSIWKLNYLFRPSKYLIQIPCTVPSYSILIYAWPSNSSWNRRKRFRFFDLFS